MTYHTRRWRPANGVNFNRRNTTRSIRVTVDREVFEAIERIAETRNLPMAAIFREAVADWLRWQVEAANQ